jgi:muramidase (phage lysozyme)
MADTSNLGVRWDLLADAGKGIGQAIGGYLQRDRLSTLGTKIQAGDYDGAAKDAFEAGDADTGLKLLGMSLSNKSSQRSDNTIGGLYGGGSSGDGATSGAAGALSVPDPATTSLPAHKKAFLNAISAPESGGAYNVRYTPKGGVAFEENGQHPGVFEPGPAGRSSAAGRYQFVKTTWDNLTGGAPFTRENQDAAALQLAANVYQQKTGRDLDADLQKGGMTPQIASVLAPTWAGLGDNPGKAIAQYNASLARYQRGGAAPDQVAGDNVAPGAPAVPPQARPGSTPPDVTATGAGASAPGNDGVRLNPHAIKLQQILSDPYLPDAKRKLVQTLFDAELKQANEPPHLMQVKGEGLVRVSPRGGPPQTVIPEKAGYSIKQNQAGDSFYVSDSDPTEAPIPIKFPGPTAAGQKALEGVDTDLRAQVTASKDKAAGAIGTLQAIDRQKRAIDAGIITGPGADFRTQARASLAQLFGIDAETASNSQAFDAAARQKGAELAKAISSSGHTTNADLNVGNVIAGADRTKTEAALRAIIDAQETLAKDQIQRHNAAVGKFAKSLGKRSPDAADTLTSNYTVEAPPVYQYGDAKKAAAAEKPPTPDARKAPDGKWYVADPNRPGKYLEVR